MAADNAKRVGWSTVVDVAVVAAVAYQDLVHCDPGEVASLNGQADAAVERTEHQTTWRNASSHRSGMGPKKKASYCAAVAEAAVAAADVAAEAVEQAVAGVDPTYPAFPSWHSSWDHW